MLKEDLYIVLNKYSDIPSNEWSKFTSFIHNRELKKGSFFIMEGDKPEWIGFIRSGLFRVYYTTLSGDERTLVFRYEGDPITAYSSILENSLSTITIEALEDSTLYIMKISDLNRYPKEFPFIAEIMNEITRKIFIEKEKREREFLSLTATERYLKFLEKYPELEKRLTQFHIASFLGISNVSLSRIRNQISN